MFRIFRPIFMGLIVSLFLCQTIYAAPNTVTIHNDSLGFKVNVDNKGLFIKAIKWQHKPVGVNYNYSLWKMKESFIKKVITHDMKILQDMGASAIVSPPGIPRKWVTYIFKKYKIMTIIHWEMARWGMTYNSAWNANPDFEDPTVIAQLDGEISEAIETYKNTSGFLMYAIGSSHNWGFGWTSERISALPESQRISAKADVIYSLIGKYTDLIHSKDTHHPVILVNGDVDQIERIYKLCPQIDVYGANSNRGPISGGIFEQFKSKMADKPFIYFSLGGNGAWSKELKAEDPVAQARVVKSQLRELYQDTYGKNTGVAIGAVLGWQDDWSMDPEFWQAWELDIHNNHEMEWQGIVAIAPIEDTEPRPIIQRPAFYVLKEAWTKLDPYSPETTDSKISMTFDYFNEDLYLGLYDNKRVEYELNNTARVQMDQLELNMMMVGYTNNKKVFASSKGSDAMDFDSEESILLGFTGYASSAFKANVQFKFTNNVSEHKLAAHDYNEKSKTYTLVGVDTLDIDGVPTGIDRYEESKTLRLYKASSKYTGENMDISAYYREGHNHWTDHGDFFHLYTEAYDYPTFDTWDMKVPYGIEFTGKKDYNGLRFAVGPKPIDGGNPSVFGMYTKEIGGVKISPVIRYDIGSSKGTGREASADPISQFTVSATKALDMYTITGGVMFSSWEKIGEEYAGKPAESSGWVIEDNNEKVTALDGLGAKLELMADYGRLKFLTLGQYMGRVASSGWDRKHTYTDWEFKDTGGSNKIMGTFGVSYDAGHLRVAPNVLYQEPIAEAMGRQQYATSYDYAPDPEFVGSPVLTHSRKTLGGELVLTYDPTPNTPMWFYDNANHEDASFAANLHLIYKHQPTETDKQNYINKQGYNVSFAVGQQPFDAYSAHFRMIYSPSRSLKTITKLYYDHKQSKNGQMNAIINAFGGSFDLSYDEWRVNSYLKINDWGPYDYMQEWNIIYPLQSSLGLSYALSNIGLFDLLKSSHVGVQVNYRTLQLSTDPNISSSVNIDPNNDVLNYETELRTYITIAI